MNIDDYEAENDVGIEMIDDYSDYSDKVELPPEAKKIRMEVDSKPELAPNCGSATRPFPEEITTVLEDLYRSGMDGWGKKHEESIHSAVARTGLSLNQVKVGSGYVQYIYNYTAYLMYHQK